MDNTMRQRKPVGELSSRRAATAFFLAVLAATVPALASGEDFEVSPSGQPFSIAEALDLAGPGDTVVLSDGVYSDPIVTVRSGEEGSPIIITGSSEAIISGSSSSNRAVTVRHSWISLEGFSVDGRTSDVDSADSFIEKCVYVWGEENPEVVEFSGGQAFASIIGFTMQGMSVRNCGGECVRLRHFVTNSQIVDNDVSNCGVRDFRYNGGAKNGEAIYIGTSSKQWAEGVPDETAFNVVRGNIITPYANECVDIKEGANNNIVEDNACQEQYDDDSGCYGSRGDDNVFRRNTGDACSGAGVRLGGWEVDGTVYGKNCDVYDNDFTNTGTGVVVAMQLPQGSVCGNSCSDGVCRARGDAAIEDQWNQPCDRVATAVGLSENDSSSGAIVEDSGKDTTTSSGGSDGEDTTPLSGGSDGEDTTTSSGGSDGGQPTTSSGGSDGGQPTTSSGGSDGEDTTTSSGGSDGGQPTTSSGGSDNEDTTTSSGGSDNEDTTTSSGGSDGGQPTTSSGGDNGGDDDFGTPTEQGYGQESSIDASSDGKSPGQEQSCQPVEILASFVTASASTQATNPAVNIVDGSLETRWSAEGPASWLLIDLPMAAPLSSVELAFEDGDERTQSFEIAIINGDGGSMTTSYTSSGETNDFQQFPVASDGGGDVVAKTVVIVGYGNSVNDWNSFTEIKLCAGGDVPSEAGRRRATRALSVAAAAATTTAAPADVAIAIAAAGGSNTVMSTVDVASSTMEKERGNETVGVPVKKTGNIRGSRSRPHLIGQ